MTLLGGARAATLAAIWLSMSACQRSVSEGGSNRLHRGLGTDEGSEAMSGEPLAPLTVPEQPNQPLAKLGARLFHDPILSKDGQVSCASCHDLEKGGDDGRARSLGVDGREGRINAPTVLNASLNASQFWDGRAATLEHQVDGPVQDPNEMGSGWSAIERKLEQHSYYKQAFQTALGGAPTRRGIKQAIAAFERTLVTPDAPFDRWLRGDEQALTDEQREGYELFKASGCVACHQGQNVGGNMYQRFGVFGDYFRERGNVTKEDYGRFNVTGVESDRHVFRVPSLRNVELTAPYFHDGSAKTLPEAIRVMAKYQLGKELSDTQVDKLVAFLKSLTGRQVKVDQSWMPRGQP